MNKDLMNFFSILAIPWAILLAFLCSLLLPNDSSSILPGKQQMEAYQSESSCKTYEELKKVFDIRVEKIEKSQIRWMNSSTYFIEMNPIFVSSKGKLLEEPLMLKADTESELRFQLIQLWYLCVVP